MLLVGSKALEYYLPLNRIIHDWDLWMSNPEFDIFNLQFSDYLVKETPSGYLYDIKGTIVEVKPESKFEPTDYHVYAEPNEKYVETPYGLAELPTIQIIYDMKASTFECIPEWKHEYDLKLIEKNFNVRKNRSLFKARLKETKARIERSVKNKYSFFHKNAYNNTKIATIPEYVVHDKLHEMVADLIGLNIPTYVKTINGDVETDMDMFNKLSYELKISLMAEESLVLALERWFIPQMVENGINYQLIPRFYNNNEASPTYQLLKHVNIKGLIGEEQEIVQFGRDNFNEIEKAWVKMKEKIKTNGGFPQWFYNELFVAREKYRNGEKVGIHHSN